MTSQSQEFAEAVLAGFVAAGLHTDAEIVKAGGPSTTTLTLFRKVAHGYGEMSKPRNPTWGRIDTAAGWPAGTARALWEGRPRPVAAMGDMSIASHFDTGGAVSAFEEWANHYYEYGNAEPDWANPPTSALALFSDEQLMAELERRLRLYRKLADTYFNEAQENSHASGAPTSRAGESPARDALALAAKRGRRERTYDDQS